MEYRPVCFKETIAVERMVTVHYFQFARGYVFSGERHDFWEFVYMDKGAAEIGADDAVFVLSEGEAVFHKPGEFHTIWAGGSKAPDIIVLSFVCRSQAMDRFAGVRMPVGDEGKRLIAQIIVEARSAWANKPGVNYAELLPREDSAPGAQQMVRISLEALLIHLFRALDAQGALAREAGRETPLLRNPLAGRREALDAVAVEAERYLSEHLQDRVTIAELCRRFNLSATSLKQLFRRRQGCGVGEYLSRLRHEGAKRMIRENRFNMTQIADRCGYGSVHYFSRRFSQLEGMSPTEYARSVKGIIEST